MKHERITDHVNHLRRKRIYYGKSFHWVSCGRTLHCVVCTDSHTHIQTQLLRTWNEFKIIYPEIRSIRMSMAGKSLLIRFFMPTALLFKINGIPVCSITTITITGPVHLQNTHTSGETIIWMHCFTNCCLILPSHFLFHILGESVCYLRISFSIPLLLNLISVSPCQTTKMRSGSQSRIYNSFAYMNKIQMQFVQPCWNSSLPMDISCFWCFPW